MEQELKSLERKNGNKREIYLDAIKVFALSLVFALHTQRGVEVTDPCHNPAFFYAARCSMPLFFMVNGALILRKGEFSFGYYKRKVLNTLRILVVWGFITAGYYLLYLRTGLKEAAKNGLKVMIAHHWVINLWFFITFIILYTILLFTFSYIKRNTWKVVIWLGIICMLVDLVSIISIFNGGFFIQDMVTQRLRLWTWAFYFCFGYALSGIELGKIKKWRAVSAAVLLTAACTALQYYICFIKTGQIESNYMYDNGLIILWCGAVFLCFRLSGSFAKILSRFARYSFGAFLMHSFFIDALNLRGIASGPVQAFAIWAALVAGCYTLSYIFSRIPVIRKAFVY